MPAAPLSCSSSSVVTISSTTSAPAPMYCVEICTWGGTKGGYWEMGNTSMATTPARTMRIAMAEAKMGRVIKKTSSGDAFMETIFLPRMLGVDKLFPTVIKTVFDLVVLARAPAH